MDEAHFAAWEAGWEASRETAVEPSDCLDAVLMAANGSYAPFWLGYSGNVRISAANAFGVAPQLGNYPSCMYAMPEGSQDATYCFMPYGKMGVCVPEACSAMDLQDPALAVGLNMAGLGLKQAVLETGQALAGAASGDTSNSTIEAIIADAGAAALFASQSASAWANLRPAESDALNSIATKLYLGSTAPVTTASFYSGLYDDLGDVGAALRLNLGFEDYASEQMGEAVLFGAYMAAVTGEEVFVCGDQAIEARAGAYVMAPLCVLLGLLVAFGSFFRYKRDKQAAELEAGSYSKLSDAIETPDKRTAFSSAASDHEEPLLGVQGRPRPAFVADESALPFKDRFLLMWAAQTNVRYLWPSKSRGAFACLDGIRAFSMFWVVMGHTLFWAEFVGFADWTAVAPPTGLMATWAGQVLASAEFSVDTFFWLGGFIATWSMLKYLNSSAYKGGVGWIPLAYVHRYLRLTPLYAFVIMFYMFLVPLMGSGPFWSNLAAELSEGCDQYWWQNLLYVNTIVNWNDGMQSCYGVSWYLGSEWWMFMCAPFMALAFHKGRRLGYGFALTGLTACLVYTVVVGKEHDVTSYTFGAGDGSIRYSYNLFYYARPWTRAPAYIIGALFGCFWTEYSAQNTKTEFELKGSTVAGLTLAYMTILYSCCYGALGEYTSVSDDDLQQSGWSDTSQLLYMAFSKPGWCVGLSILSFLCFQGYGYVAQELMGADILVPAARLSFAAYLTHSTVIEVLYYQATAVVTYSGTWWAVQFLGVLSTTFVIALVLHLCVEKPLDNLERSMLKR